MEVKMLIKPHGRRLINKVLKGKHRKEAEKKAKELKKICVSNKILRDIENIAKGVFSPLEGFLCKEDFDSVIYNKRLANGIPFPIPIVLDVKKGKARQLKEEDIAIADKLGNIYAILHLQEKYVYNKNEFAKNVYGTLDLKHPGVNEIYNMGDVLLGGKIDLIKELNNPYERYTLDPIETRILFKEKGWKKVCAFQTRNVPHLGHENLQKIVLSLCDGLLIHPIIGKKKKGDFKDDVILKAYDVLIKNYFAKDRVVLSILPTEMRYAGPREAIFHAIVRKNYGCTHLIVGRDHAGVGNYYHPEAAIEIFDEFKDLEIKPITIKGDFFYCKKCYRLESERTCPHKKEYHVEFSGTLIRKMINEGKLPPKEVMRKEVFEILTKEKNLFVE
jgi:sulfate adenylyltransferase